jgi:hypothetical protein
MGVSKETQDGFYSGNKTEKMRYTINDPVELISGNNEGEKGSVISIIESEPEFKYLVELSTGKDIEIEQSLLHSI